MKYRVLWTAAIAGVALHLAGLAIDAYMHATDSTLAAREGVFTLSNPSHALIIAGLGVTTTALLGVGFLWAQDRGFGGESRLATVLRAATVPAVALGAAGAIWLATLAEENTSHSHTDAVRVDDHGHDALGTTLDPAVAAFTAKSVPHAHDTTSPESAMAEGNAHTHGTEIAVSPAQLEAASAFYAQVKESAASYTDVSQAIAAGYVQITPDLPGIAAHFINAAYSADGDLMNPAHPEILLYSKRMDGQWRLVGFMFSSETVTEVPPSFFGPLDVWHRHENLCFTANAGVSVKNSRSECVAGLFVKTTPWNLHVWTAEGASGVFAHDFAPISPGAFPGASRPAAQELVARR